MEDINDLPEGTKGPNNFEHAEEYSSLQAIKKLEHQKFLDRLEPSIESEEFKAEMADPREVLDHETGITFGVYEVNRNASGEPLVVNLAWSCIAGTGVGRVDVLEFSSRINRPIKVIDMLATGGTDIPTHSQRKNLNFVDLADAELRVLDRIGVNRFDIAGYSMGGVMAAGIAAQAGERVGHLITMAAPGFSDVAFLDFAKHFVVDEGRNAKKYASTARASILEQHKAANADSKGPINFRNATTLLKLATLMSKEATAQAITNLSPKTRWTDIVGSEDRVADWTGHLEAVRARNALFPNSSNEHVLGSETHSMGDIHRPAVAEMVALTLHSH